MSYNPGAEIMWGQNRGQTLVGASSYGAAVDARILTEEALILKKTIEANYSKFPKEYIIAFNKWIKSWADFVRSISRTDLPWYAIFKQMSASAQVMWYGPEIYNAVQDYRAKYIKLWSLASKVLGKDATAFKPADPKPRVSDTPVVDALASVVKGVLVVGALGVGAYVLVNLWGKPKAHAVPAE